MVKDKNISTDVMSAPAENKVSNLLPEFNVLQ